MWNLVLGNTFCVYWEHILCLLSTVDDEHYIDSWKSEKKIVCNVKVSSRQHILCVFPTADDGQYIDWDGDSNIDARQHILRVFPTVHNGQYMIVDHVKVTQNVFSETHSVCIAYRWWWAIHWVFAMWTLMLGNTFCSYCLRLLLVLATLFANKLQVISRKRATKYRALLRKMSEKIAYRWYAYWQRPIGCLIFISHFPQKSPIIDWCCFHYVIRNSLVVLLEALFAI